MLPGEGMAPFVDRRRHAELKPLPGLSSSLLRRKGDSEDDDGENDSSRRGKSRFNNKSRGDGNGDSNGRGSGGGGGGGGGDSNTKGSGGGKKNNKSSDDDSGGSRSKSNDNNDDENDSNTRSGSSSAAPPPPIVVNPQLSTPPPAVIPAATSSLPPADPTTVTVEPATVTVSPTTVVVMSTVFPDASTPIAQNPAVTSFASISTTGLPTDPANSQPRKGVDEPEEFSATPAFSITQSSSTIPTALANTTPTALADNSGDKHGDGNERHRGSPGNGDNNPDKNGGMSQTTEHLLISAGSIGSFILVCFVAWFVWRTMKKSKKRRGVTGGSRFTRADKILNKVPWIARRRRAGWDDLGDGSMDLRGAPPSYREKTQSTTLQTQEYYTAAPDKIVSQNQNERAFLPEMTSGQTDLARSLTTNTGYSHQAGESFSSINAAQFMGTMQTDPNLTVRSRMPDAFYNQSELARQPSDAYDPTRRQVNRASELSSLSSGFGDGDIIIPETYIRPPQPASQALRQSNNYVGRFSWMSRKSSAFGYGANRDTIYTQSSEDSPPRFRSVNSWVNQQTGRVRRAEQRSNEEIPPVPGMPVPGIHNPPPEPEMTMMMDDGQTPRRPGT